MQVFTLFIQARHLSRVRDAQNWSLAPNIATQLTVTSTVKNVM